MEAPQYWEGGDSQNTPQTNIQRNSKQYRSRVVEIESNTKPTPFNNFNFSFIPIYSDYSQPLDNLHTNYNKDHFKTRSPKQKDRTKKYWFHRRQLRAEINETCLFDDDDQRPYADVTILSKQYRGLMDSGSTITAFGAGSEFFLNNPQYTIHHIPSNVKTAGGDLKRVFGYLLTTVTYQNQQHSMKIFIVPSLKQQLYLGIDFWKLFNILPSSISLQKPIISEVDTHITDLDCDLNKHHLTSDQQVILEETIKQFPSFSELGLGKTTKLSHSIKIMDGILPVKQRYYAVSPAVQAELYKEIDRMLALGVIEESNSSWSSPVTLVRKPGKVRLCLDARRLNAVTVKDAYPLPIIDGLLSRLDQTRFISSIDLKDAFWQVLLDQDSRDKTAFVIPGRPLYQFAVMPFGLCNAPQTMCRLMHKVIPTELHDQVFVYLDDLLITSGTFDDHIKLLRKVADLLKEANLTVNLDKSKFLLKSIRYLGFIVSDGNLRVDHQKVDAVTNFPEPNTSKKVRRFLGLTGWYRRFIPQYASIAAPLTDLLKKNQKLVWSPECQRAFDTLKHTLCTAPVLVYPNFQKPFTIQCDASTIGVGSVLTQIGDDGEEHPIAYMSKKLNRAQQNYSITELECYAAVLSVKHFRVYVEGSHFTIITDHASLKWLMNSKDLNGRLARWSLKLQSFDFSISHRKGTLNVVPDSLSRMFLDELNFANLKNIILKDVPQLDFDSQEFASAEYTDLIRHIQNSPKPLENFIVQDGKIFVNISRRQDDDYSDVPPWKVYVPSPLRPELIYSTHNPPSSGHPGIKKTLYLLQRYFYWPKMPMDVQAYVRQCDICKTCKSVNHITQPKMGDQAVIERPMQRLYMDFLGPYPYSKKGHCYLFIVLDHFSKYVFFKPMRNAVSIEVCNFLENVIFLQYSVPESIVSDNAQQFNSKLLRDLLDKYGVSHIYTPRYSPQSNLSERVNRSILAAIRAYIADDHRNWDSHLPEIEHALRNVIHESTKFSPHFILFGQHIISHATEYRLLRELNLTGERDISAHCKANRMNRCHELILLHLKKAYDKASHTYNLRSVNREFVEGQRVFVKNYVQSDAANKFFSKFARKAFEAKVLKRVGKVAYELEVGGKSIGIFHARDITI